MIKHYNEIPEKCNTSCKIFRPISNKLGYCRLIHVDIDDPTGGLVIVNDDCQIPFYESLYGKLRGDSSDSTS
jgi:hypothetical protein